jgi:hypothetical protein
LRHAKIALLVAVVGAALACASKPENRTHGKPTPPPLVAPPPASSQATHVSKVAESPEAVATRLGVDSARLKWSPDRSSYAVAVAPKADVAGAAPYRLAVFGATGERRAEVEATRPGVVEDLRFLGEARLMYRIAPLAVSPDKRTTKPKPAGKKKTPPLQTTLYVIQPFAPIAPPMACEGHSFIFSSNGDHVAWVNGAPGREWLGADGEHVYPRTGVTNIQGEPAWSPDGRSLALIEVKARPRLVVLVEFDNPHGDNVWPLPPEATDPTMRVFWAGPGRLVVGHEITQPVFATSFRRQ